METLHGTGGTTGFHRFGNCVIEMIPVVQWFDHKEF